MIKLEFETIEEFNAFIISIRRHDQYYTTWTNDGCTNDGWTNIIGTNVKMPSKTTATEEPRKNTADKTFVDSLKDTRG